MKTMLTRKEISKINDLIDNGDDFDELGDEIFGYVMLFWAGISKKKRELPETDIKYCEGYTKILVDNGYKIKEVKNKLKTIKEHK
jgi:hypothetical protein